MINPHLTLALEKVFCLGLKEAKKDEYYVDDGKFHIMRKFNGSILIYGRRRSYFPFQCFIGPDWPMVVMVYTLVIVINAVVLYAISGVGYPVIIIGGIGTLVILISYSMTSCSDPGIIYECDYATPLTSITESVNRDIESDPDSTVSSRSPAEPATSSSSSSSFSPQSFSASVPKNLSGSPLVPAPDTIECGQCQIQRPHSGHHCYFCKNCIDKLDHHCPWCGKCIGRDNMMAFSIFLSSLCFQFYFLIGAGIYYAISVYVAGVPQGAGFR